MFRAHDRAPAPAGEDITLGTSRRLGGDCLIRLALLRSAPISSASTGSRSSVLPVPAWSSRSSSTRSTACSCFRSISSARCCSPNGAHRSSARSPAAIRAATTLGRAGGREMIAHVWTRVGSSDNRVRRPLVDRCIAALDAHGVISAGHATLEAPTDRYISRYPAVGRERAPAQFSRTLQAIAKSNVRGRFEPDYPTASVGWRESTQKVRFGAFAREDERR
ncbi:MAG: hypothetical protein ABI846_04740 [Rudaea sp.]